MAIQGISNASPTRIDPSRTLSEGEKSPSTGSATPSGTPLPLMGGASLVQATSGDVPIPGDTPGSTVSPNKFGNPMQAYEDKKSELTQKEAELEAAEKTLEGYESDLEAKQVAVDEKEGTLDELETLEAQLLAVQKKGKLNDQGKEYLKTLQSKIAELKLQIEGLKSDIAELESLISAKETAIDDYNKNIASLQEELGETESFSAEGDIDGDGVKNKNDPDIDGDGINNAKEVQIGTNPFSIDSDNDGVTDIGELILKDAGYTFDPLNADSDGDGISDLLEAKAINNLSPAVMNQIFTAMFGNSGTGGTNPSGGTGEAQETSIPWDSPANDAESLTYNNKVISNSQEIPNTNNTYGKDGVFTVPFTSKDKVLYLSKGDDDIQMEKSGNNLIVTIVAPDKDGTVKTNKWTFQDAFDANGKLTFKLYLMDTGTGVETMKITGFDLKGSLQLNSIGTKITGGIYLSEGDEKDKWGAGGTKFQGITKIEAYETQFNPTGNNAASVKAKPDPNDGVMTATLSTQDFFFNENKGTFYFPTEIIDKDGNKVDVKKFKVSTTEAGNVIIDVLGKGDKVIFRYKLVGQEINVTNPDTGEMEKKQLSAKDLIIGKGGDFSITFQLADGGQYVDFLGVNDKVTVYGGSGDDLIKANGTVHGGAGDDFIVAGTKGLTAYGEGGYDYLVGDQGTDLLDGGDGNDFIISGEGTVKDTLLGGNDNDMIITQGKGAHTVDGGQGKDMSNAMAPATLSGIDVGISDLNGYLSYLKEVWGDSSGMKLDEVIKAYKDGTISQEMLSEALASNAMQILIAKQTEMEDKFLDPETSKEDEKKDGK